MPTYDYQCRECQTRFEARHAIDDEIPPCIACGGEARRLILSPPAVHDFLARGRDKAARSLPECGKGCRCCP
jgi:putative FmdB family regulatory protein